MGTQKAARLTVWAVIVALGAIVVTLLPSVRFAYRNHDLHLVLETAEALVALLAAFLVFGRFRRAALRRDLLVAYSLGLLGSVNLLSVGSGVAGMSADAAMTWGTLFARFAGAGVFAYAATVSVEVVRPAGVRRAGSIHGVRLIGSVLFTLLTIFGIVAVAKAVLPDPVSVTLPASESAQVVIEGHPLMLLVQALSVLFYAAAAAGFTVAARREDDDLLLWFGAGAIISTAARVSYLLFPSLYSDYVYVGDLLRLTFYVLLLIGAAREIRLYWQEAAAAAAYEARRSLARDLHDGVAQELVFIAAQSKRIERGNEPDFAKGISKLSSASERAVAEARRAIRALVNSSEETLAEAVTEVAGDMTTGADLRLDLELDHEVDVTPAVREGLLRIMSEALRNAVRHSTATSVKVTVSGGEAVALAVEDDGRGFDIQTSRGEGFGLVTMAEQAEALGGRLIVTSAPGRGARVEVVLDG